MISKIKKYMKYTKKNLWLLKTFMEVDNSTDLIIQKTRKMKNFIGREQNMRI